ncbi:SCY1-like protein 2 [Saccostrea echinata]|uniref:SCY1-like protein 2 n=1 Tax=Saccostrea echinata TaxID=191078 RepID=UPI002A828972|nr:SCY1-like protein 2 [Saccostrea echinata]
MDVFNKLRSAVSSALPGNPLSKDFDVSNHIASGGPELSWKIYNAIKRTTKQEAAVFVFEKKQLEKYSKRDRELVIESLKKGVSQLTRLRHPKILSVLHPLEESREALAFATEPVFASLANVLGDHTNVPTPVPPELAEFKLFEVEIKHGVLQLTEGLGFLHKDAKIMHNNVCPSSIIINKYGSWKLAGFDFCVPNANQQDQSNLFPCNEWNPDQPPVTQPDLDYMAPEYYLTHSCSEASDMFSLGVLIYCIYNHGKALYECHGQLSQFKKFVEELRKFRSSLLGSVPDSLQQYVKLLLNTEPTVRPDPSQLMKVDFFDDVGTVTLQFMDTLFQRDNLQKSEFFRGLPKIMKNLPKRVNLQRILPPLVKESVNADMVPFTLPSLLLMADQATETEYRTIIFPALIPLLKIKEPIQVSLIFMQNMKLLLKKTPKNEITNHILPMIHQSLEADNSQLQDMCLDIVPTFAGLIEFSALKKSILPRIKKICLSTGTLSVRINCLLCIGKLLEYMDKWTVLDDVLPLLPQIPSREPAVLMSILGIYQVTMSHAKLGITKDILATKVLPFLIPVSIDSNLNLSQFSAYITTIKDMINKLEAEHSSKLEQIDKMRQEQKTIEITKITGQDEKATKTGEPKTMMDQFLSGFGVEQTVTNSKHTPEPSRTPTPASAKDSESKSVPKTLSLEEKQRLAQQQEQQRRFKEQKPLTMSASKAAPSVSKSQPKDLTASLMNSNTMGQPRMIGNQGLMGQQSMNSNVMQFSQAVSSTGGFPNYSGVGSMGQSQSSSGIRSTSTTNSKQSFDLSAFDSILPSTTQPKATLNQMSGIQSQGSSLPMSSSSFSSMMNQPMRPQINMMPGQPGMMGNSGFMGQQGMMGNQGIMGSQGMMGNQGFMGQQNMMRKPPPMMQGQFNMPMNSMNIPQNQGSSNSQSSNITSNDISDIFG